MKERAKLSERFLGRGCAFSPDGKWIASGCGDGVLRVWDTVKLQARTIANIGL